MAVSPVLLCLLAAAPQSAPRSPVIVVSGAVQKGRVQPAALRLGDGGLSPKPHRVLFDAGRLTTPGGAVVQARAEGVRLTMPNGKQLMITPYGRVHLRTGERSGSWTQGVKLMLADGALVTARRGAYRKPLASVDVQIAGRSYRLWDGSKRRRSRNRQTAFTGPTLLVLGSGDELYQVTSQGALLVLEDRLHPRGRKAGNRVVILGDVLISSMQRLPAHAPRRSVQFPQVREAALKLSDLSTRLFPKRPVGRPIGAVGEVLLPLAEGFRLKLEAPKKGPLRLGLYRGAAETPALEWLFGPRSELYFVRPNAHLDRGPRYFLRGLDLRELVQDLLPTFTTYRDRERIRQVIRGMGAGSIVRGAQRK